MKSRILGIAFIVLCSYVIPSAGQERASDSQIRAAIRHLRAESSKRSFEIFYRNPERATELLIAALKPTARGQYRKHPQVVWFVRALRSLTGLDFRATTKAELTSDEAHFLGADAQSQVRFFGTWMSRDVVWVAPDDAQVAIIREWREWFALHGRGYSYTSDRNFDHWYF